MGGVCEGGGSGNGGRNFFFKGDSLQGQRKDEVFTHIE